MNSHHSSGWGVSVLVLDQMTALLWGPPCVEAWVRKGDMGTSLVVQDGKESACNAADLGLIPKLGRSPGEGNGNPLQYSYLENPMD